SSLFTLPRPHCYDPTVGFEEVVESRIQEAMAQGAFERLRGAGRPFDFAVADHRLAGPCWMGFRVLQNGGMLPAWLELAREIESDLARLEDIDRRHAALVASVAAPAD